MILRELERKPVRTALSAIGFAMAVGVLVVGRFNLDAVDYLLRTQFDWADRGDLTVTFSETVPARAARELAHEPGVLKAEGLRSVPVRIRAGQRWRDLALMGHPDDADLMRVVDVHGHVAPLPERGVVLTRVLGDLLNVKVGDTLRFEVREGNRQTLEIPVAGFVDEMIGLQAHIRLNELSRLLVEEPAISSVLLDIDPTQQEALTRRLNDMPKVTSITSRQANIDKIRKQMGETVVVMTLIVTALAATIAIGVIYNNARIALSMRSRDLASLRVLGFTRREISSILLGEMAVQVMIALPLGMMIGRWLASLLASNVPPERFRLPIVISTQTYAFAAVVALLSALVSALLVRRQLDHLDLIGVLKARE
jgi:putative ABC transport system permease protein